MCECSKVRNRPVVYSMHEAGASVYFGHISSNIHEYSLIFIFWQNFIKIRKYSSFRIVFYFQNILGNLVSYFLEMIIFSYGGMLTQKRIGVARISHIMGAHEGSKESYVKIQNLCYT